MKENIGTHEDTDESLNLIAKHLCLSNGTTAASIRPLNIHIEVLLARNQNRTNHSENSLIYGKGKLKLGIFLQLKNGQVNALEMPAEEEEEEKEEQQAAAAAAEKTN